MEHKLIFSEFYTITTEITNSFYSFDIYHNIVILFLKTFFKKTYNNLFQSGEEYYQNYILFVPYIHEIENLKRNFISSSIFELIIEFSEVFRKFLEVNYPKYLEEFIIESKNLIK